MKSKKQMRDGVCYIMGVGLLCGGYEQNKLVQAHAYQNPGADQLLNYECLPCSPYLFTPKPIIIGGGSIPTGDLEQEL
jgi:hypothetical protein